MAPIRTLVCDDEQEAREGLVALSQRDPEIAVVGTARNGEEAVDAITRHVPDLVFLDVQMPRLDGFGVIDRLPAHQHPVVVFVTAHDEFALRAFEVHAQDYLVKPFSDARFSTTLARAKATVCRRRATELGAELTSLLGNGTAPSATSTQSGPDAAATPHLRYIGVRVGASVLMVNAEDIDWVEADDAHVVLHTATAAHRVRDTMHELEARLDPRDFVRVHRSAIVRLDRVRSLDRAPSGAHSLILTSGARIPLSRARRAAFQALAF